MSGNDFDDPKWPYAVIFLLACALGLMFGFFILAPLYP